MSEINNQTPNPDPNQNQNKPAEGKNTSGIDKEALKTALGEILGMDPEELTGTVKRSFDRQVQDARKEIHRQTDNAVEKDEVFGKMIVGENKDDRLEAIKEMVKEDVLGNVANGEPFGAELVSRSIQKIRARITKFGIPNELKRDPITLGLGPNSGLPAEVTSEKPIERVPASDDGYVQNVVARMLQKQYRS